MTDLAIHVEGVGKQYRIGTRQRGYRTLRESLVDAVAGPFRRLLSPLAPHVSPPGNTFWALKDVSFEIKRGEVVGVIGRNGAGKSTLLKILSRITKPTEGLVRVRGRVGSLLEVGTGFHPELTGRENTYLNGAILGMRKPEIERKFDEIVSFAEIGQFIDTPVKHYSSGMYVRLAFAVSAHLETEVLLVDEVLAVGDNSFQKKCLGKMDDVARGGRTVVFVSHNMQAIQSLCTSAIRLDAGVLAARGAPRTLVAEYLTSLDAIGTTASWPLASAPGNDDLRLLGLRVRSESSDEGGHYSSRQAVHIDLHFLVRAASPALCVGFDLIAASGTTVLRSYHTDMASARWPSVRLGENHWRCTIPAGVLNAGDYFISPRIGLHNIAWIVHLDTVARFEILLDHGVSPFWSVLNSQNRPGVIAPILEWEARHET